MWWSWVVPAVLPACSEIVVGGGRGVDHTTDTGGAGIGGPHGAEGNFQLTADCY